MIFQLIDQDYPRHNVQAKIGAAFFERCHLQSPEVQACFVICTQQSDNYVCIILHRIRTIIMSVSPNSPIYKKN